MVALVGVWDRVVGCGVWRVEMEMEMGNSEKFAGIIWDEVAVRFVRWYNLGMCRKWGRWL